MVNKNREFTKIPDPDTIQIWRCCMCPQRGSPSKQCPIGKPCRFVRRFKDFDGQIHEINNLYGDVFDADQEKLNAEAESKEWHDTEGMEFLKLPGVVMK